MLESRSIQNLCCITQATLLNACLGDDDLRELGVGEEGPNRMGLSPAVRGRALLHRACHRDADAARRLSDLLDLRHLDAVVLVRCKDEDELEETVDRWVSRPDGESLPGLLWALCTDRRDEVHALGARLCHEAVTVAFRTLIGKRVPLRPRASE